MRLLPPATPPNLPALPPESEASKLSRRIDEFCKHFGRNSIQVRFLNAIAAGAIFDEGLQLLFEQLAFQCAVETYRHEAQNMEMQEIIKDADNPVNWQQIKDPCPNCHYPGFYGYCGMCAFDERDVS